MAPGLIPTLMMLTTAAFRMQNRDQCTLMPPELVGVWVGPDQYVDDDSSVGTCEPAYAAFQPGAHCSYHWLEACSPDTFSIEDSYSYSITSYTCSGKAEGFVYDVENTTGDHSCNYFKRDGNTLTYVYGEKTDRLEDVVCPEGEVGVSETVSGSFTGVLSDREDSADEADFACT
ncbi:hypothetical protein BSKO_12442 [Bryopsis sp. KO-2023]|nr:hypothetical protein BSKO_12442 [Bryopsis sp. KO-2023]